MFDVIYKLLKTAALEALPSELRTNVLYDALDKDATPKMGRVVAVTIENTDAQQMTVGRNPRYQVDGSLIIRLYEPSGDGEGPQAAIGTQIARLLTRQKLKDGTTTVQLMTGSLLNSGRSGVMWERLVRVPFKATFYLS